MERSCSHCDNPDSSLLRIVLIGEIIRADDVTLYTMAEIFQTLGILELSLEDEVPEVKRKPHPQANLPPLPVQAYTPPRPPDVVRAAYVFAAEHPEILSYVPCFCGCERGGHKGNDDCFVARRDASGKPTEWVTHGSVCEVCIDVATKAMQMTSAGATLAQTREALRRAGALMARYADVPMDFADATLVALAEEMDRNAVFTLDRRGFSAYRVGRRSRFAIVP